MKICLTSDTHYGFSEDTESLLRTMLSNMRDESPDMIIHAGDWASTKHSELESCLALFREYFPDTTIVGAIGNHDFYNGDEEMKFNSVELMMESIEQLMTKYNISNHAVVNNVNIIAFQSWYKTLNPPSNDYFWCPDGHGVHSKMKMKMLESFEETKKLIQSFPGYKHIVVSHFTPYNYRYGYTGMCGPMGLFDTLIESGISHLCLGHSHEYQNEQIEQCLVLNAGSDYDEPKYSVFEV